jgi:hypothetical protein
MSVLIEDVLNAWREAERLLDGTQDGAERESLEETIEHLRHLYAELTSASEVTAL